MYKFCFVFCMAILVWHWEDGTGNVFIVTELSSYSAATTATEFITMFFMKIDLWWIKYILPQIVIDSVYFDQIRSTLTPWPMSLLSNVRPAHWQTHGAEERRSGLVHSVLPSLPAQLNSAQLSCSNLSAIVETVTPPGWRRTSLHMGIWWSIYVVHAEGLRGSGFVLPPRRCDISSDGSLSDS